LFQGNMRSIVRLYHCQPCKIPVTVFTEVSPLFSHDTRSFFLACFFLYSICFFDAGLASVVLVAEACRDYERQQPPPTNQSQPGGGKPLLQKQNSTNSLLLMHNNASSSSLHRLPPPPYPGPPPPPGRLTRPLPASSPSSSSSSHLLSKTDPRPSSDPSQLYQVPYRTYGVLRTSRYRSLLVTECSKQCCGSGSAFILVGWIQIRIGNTDPDP
jgi:hypothetical protein